MDALVDTWHIHNRINTYLLDSIPGDVLGATASSKGRTVGEQFAHLHNVRLMWIKAAMPEALVSLEKVEKEGISKDILRSALVKSGETIAVLLAKAVRDGRVKGFKPHPTGFLGYLISHESHHRGQIMMTLKQDGYPTDKKIAFGLWEWGVR